MSIGKYKRLVKRGIEYVRAVKEKDREKMVEWVGKMVDKAAEIAGENIMDKYCFEQRYGQANTRYTPFRFRTIDCASQITRGP